MKVDMPLNNETKLNKNLYSVQSKQTDPDLNSADMTRINEKRKTIYLHINIDQKGEEQFYLNLKK